MQSSIASVNSKKASLQKWLHILNMEDWIQYKRQAAVARKLLKNKEKLVFRELQAI